MMIIKYRNLAVLTTALVFSLFMYSVDLAQADPVVRGVVRGAVVGATIGGITNGSRGAATGAAIGAGAGAIRGHRVSNHRRRHRY